MIEVPSPAHPAVTGGRIRRIIIEQSRRANVGHIGSCLSVADILACLYGDLLRADGPDDPDRDRFALSKGHAALALYAALRLRGWLTDAELDTFCTDGTPARRASAAPAPRPGEREDQATHGEVRVDVLLLQALQPQRDGLGLGLRSRFRLAVPPPRRLRAPSGGRRARRPSCRSSRAAGRRSRPRRRTRRAPTAPASSSSPPQAASSAPSARAPPPARTLWRVTPARKPNPNVPGRIGSTPLFSADPPRTCRHPPSWYPPLSLAAARAPPGGGARPRSTSLPSPPGHQPWRHLISPKVRLPDNSSDGQAGGFRLSPRPPLPDIAVLTRRSSIRLHRTRRSAGSHGLTPGRYVQTNTPVAAGRTADTSSSGRFHVSSGNKRLPPPSRTGSTISRYSSTRPSAMSWRANLGASQHDDVTTGGLTLEPADVGHHVSGR